MSVGIGQKFRVKKVFSTFDERIRVGDRCFVYDAPSYSGRRVLILSFSAIPRVKEPDMSHFEYLCEDRGVEDYLEKC
jgi:hypothetical protein